MNTPPLHNAHVAQLDGPDAGSLVSLDSDESESDFYRWLIYHMHCRKRKVMLLLLIVIVQTFAFVGHLIFCTEIILHLWRYLECFMQGCCFLSHVSKVNDEEVFRSSWQLQFVILCLAQELLCTYPYGSQTINGSKFMPVNNISLLRVAILGRLVVLSGFVNVGFPFSLSQLTTPKRIH